MEDLLERGLGAPQTGLWVAGGLPPQSAGEHRDRPAGPARDPLGLLELGFAGGRLELRGLAEDVLLELAERRAGLDPEVLRELPPETRPEKVLGCEVWRALDWLVDGDKVALPVGGRDNLASALLGVFDSQIAGGKRYDLATLGRRRANATYFQSHAVDQAQAIIFGMDLTPLIVDTTIDPLEFAVSHIREFEEEVRNRFAKLR